MKKSHYSNRDNIRLGPDVGNGILRWLLSAILLVLTILYKDIFGNSWGYWLLITLCSLGLLLSTVYLIPGAFSLKLDERGFAITAFFKKRFVNWGDCTEFRTKDLRAKYITVGRAVVYSINSERQGKKLFGILPGRVDYHVGTWELDTTSLCELMNMKRKKFIENN